ncbi:pilin, partial [Patescibacteria group bacterium]|nr:pilin [Patescibacteria group bacterium]
MHSWRFSLKISLIVLVLAGGFFGLTPHQAQAQNDVSTFAKIQEQGIIFAGICASRGTPCACRDQGRCELENILQIMVNIGTFILAISGSILVAMFVFGGVTWLTSLGNPNRIDEGKKTMVGAVIGILIVFFAYTGVTLLISVLKTGNIPTGDLEDVIRGQEDTVPTPPRSGYCARTDPATGESVPCSSNEICHYYGIDPNSPGNPLSLGDCVFPDPVPAPDTRDFEVPFET